MLFGEMQPFKMKANIDLKIVETLILALDIKEVQKFYMDDDFSETFASMICDDFISDTKNKHISKDLVEGELPIECLIHKKFMMVDEFFTNSTLPMPKILKKLTNESVEKHEERVKMYLLACPDTKFSEIAEIIDPSNVF